MSKTHYIPPPSHIPLIRSGEITKFLVMVKPQPKGSDIIKIGDGHVMFVPGDVFPLQPPYAIGQDVAVKETWAYKLLSCDVVYRADYPQDVRYRWRSPVTQPLTAVRTWIVPTGVKVVRVNDVIFSDRLKLGLLGTTSDPNKLRDYIITRFGQSAWDTNAFCFLYDFKLKQ